MAKRVRKLPLPKTLPELRAYLEKLKNKEAQLLADLALREAPEFEDAIVALVSSEVLFTRAERTLMLAEKPEEEEGNDTVKRQLTFFQRRRDQAARSGRSTAVYDERIANLKGLLVSTKVQENFTKYRDDRDKKAATYVACWNEWEPQFIESEVRLATLLPTGAESYKRACLCVGVTPNLETPNETTD